MGLFLNNCIKENDFPQIDGKVIHISQITLLVKTKVLLFRICLGK